MDPVSDSSVDISNESSEHSFVCTLRQMLSVWINLISLMLLVALMGEFAL